MNRIDDHKEMINMHMLKFMTAATAGAAITLAASIGGTIAATSQVLPIEQVSAPTSSPTNLPTPKWMTTPCEYEDSPNCYWDGGNHSFYSVLIRTPKGHTKMCTIYMKDRYAKKHNHCTGL